MLSFWPSVHSYQSSLLLFTAVISLKSYQKSKTDFLKIASLVFYISSTLVELWLFTLPLVKSLILLRCSVFTAYLCQCKSRYSSTPSRQKFLQYWYRARYVVLWEVMNPRVANVSGHVFAVCGSTNRESSLLFCPPFPQRGRGWL